jgi:hypothetical protein
MKNFAFPTPEDAYCGLSKLEYVSCAVLCAMIANPKMVTATEEDEATFDFVTDSIDMADFAVAQAKVLLGAITE